MSNENTSIHDFDINLICEYYAGVERQGPGSPDVTLKALSFIDKPGADTHILDLGCGSGSQSMVLAQHTPAQITGIDLFPGFIEQYNRRAADQQCSERVKGITGSMFDIPYPPESIDVIWSEGAIYNIGFQRGLQEWHSYLKSGGYVAVTEASWFTAEQPAEIHDFWMQAYPEIDTIPRKVAQLQEAGYVPVAAFILPEECWTDWFYKPQAAAQELFLKKYPGDKTAEALIANERHEEQLYHRYKAYYGYVFYIGRKI